MGDGSIERVKELYGFFARKDIPALLEGLAPDATWAMVGREEDVPMCGLRQGKQGAASFFRIMSETVEITRFEPREFRASGDRVYVHGVWSYIARNNGRPGENEWLHVFTFGEDGLVTSWRGHNDTAQIAAVRALPPVDGQRQRQAAVASAS